MTGLRGGLARGAPVLAALAIALSGCGGGGGGSAAEAEFASPTSVQVTGYAGDIMEPFLTRDGRRLFFNNRNDPAAATNLHAAERVDDLTFRYLGEIPGANVPTELDAVASADAAGRFYFVSLRSYGSTLASIFAADLAATSVVNVTAVAGVARLSPGFVNFDAEVSADGERLYYVDGHFSGGPVPDAADILVAARTGPASFAPLANAADLLRSVNTTAALEYAPALTADEREIFFTRLDPAGSPQLFRASRATRAEPFGPARRIDAASGIVEAATVAPDGRALYYHALVGGSFVLRRVTR